jgi:hypothetical protein
MDGQIEGMMMTPCFSTKEEFRQAYQEAKFGVNCGFIGAYRDHLAGLHIVASCAKSYILEHFEEVEDWSGLDVKVMDSTGETVHYYKHKDSSGDWADTAIAQAFREHDEEMRRKQRPVESVTEPVLDPSDGDFSITINGRDHMWINDEAVVIIADYIERSRK